MILYRAMTIEEYQETLKRGHPHFIRRYKFFSPLKEFVENRVMNSIFANGHLKNKYSKLIAFEIPDDAPIQKLNPKEIMIDRRKSHLIEWKIIEVSK